MRDSHVAQVLLKLHVNFHSFGVTQSVVVHNKHIHSNHEMCCVCQEISKVKNRKKEEKNRIQTYMYGGKLNETELHFLHRFIRMPMMCECLLFGDIVRFILVRLRFVRFPSFENSYLFVCASKTQIASYLFHYENPACSAFYMYT